MRIFVDYVVPTCRNGDEDESGIAMHAAQQLVSNCTGITGIAYRRGQRKRTLVFPWGRKNLQSIPPPKTSGPFRYVLYSFKTTTAACADVGRGPIMHVRLLDAATLQPVNCPGKAASNGLEMSKEYNEDGGFTMPGININDWKEIHEGEAMNGCKVHPDYNAAPGYVSLRVVARGPGPYRFEVSVANSPERALSQPFYLTRQQDDKTRA